MTAHAALMEQLRSRRELLNAERAVLRALCQGAPERLVWTEGMAILANYVFEDDVHQLIFSTLRELCNGDPRILGEQLLARLTNKGFPALDLEDFFRPHGLTAARAVELMRALAARTAPDAQPNPTLS